MTHRGTWFGLALLLAGCILGLLPLLPASPTGGGVLQNLPHLQAWETSALAGLGIGVMWASRRKS